MTTFIPDDEDAPVAVKIAETAAEQQEAAAGQQVRVEDPDQGRLREAEVGTDRRQRDVDDGRVQNDHQHPHAEDVEGQPTPLLHRHFADPNGRPQGRTR